MEKQSRKINTYRIRVIERAKTEKEEVEEKFRVDKSQKPLN